MPTLKTRRDKAIGLSLRLKERLKEMGFPDWVWLFKYGKNVKILFICDIKCDTYKIKQLAVSLVQ